MYRLLRSVAFGIDAERAHGLALRAHRALRPFHRGLTEQPRTVMGMRFSNAVGLAAGYDKDAAAWRGLAALGFGHIEVGTVTPRPQPGSPRPRLFRIPDEQALINRMGFPSEGADAVAARLPTTRPDGLVLGVSIGPNGFADAEQATRDYELLVDRFAPLADYLSVNVSSPNTPGLRTLQSGDDLAELLSRIVAGRDRQAAVLEKPVPLVVKLSPDIPPSELPATIAAADLAGVDGIIVTNTTTQRPGVASPQRGGLSGAPLRSISLDILRRVRELTTLPLIASGGIMTVADARDRLDAGASLVQVYTGFVYQGPSLVRGIAALL